MDDDFNGISIEALDTELRDFFEMDEELLNEWINTPLPILYGQKPCQLFSSVEGRKQIVYMLGIMASGDMT